MVKVAGSTSRGPSAARQRSEFAAKLHADRDALRGELLGMWKADVVDRARLHAIVDQRIDAMRAAAHAAADGAADAHDVLTVEQREKLAKKAERWRK